MRVHPSFMRCESQRQCDTARRLRLLPVPGHVDDPVPAGRLLLVVPLVLAGGIGVIDHRSANAAIIDIVIAPRPCSSLAVKRSDFGSTMVDPVALMAHVHHVRDPDLAVVGLPVALLGDPLLLGLGGGRTGRGGRGSAEASEIALDPRGGARLDGRRRVRVRAATAARSRWGPRRPDRPSSSDSSPPRGPRPTRWRAPADGPPSGSGSETPRPSTARRAGRFTSRGEMGGGRGRGPDGPRFSFPGDAELPPSKCLGRWELDTTIYCACNGDTRLLFG